jgi:hypothetical protein
MSRWIELNLELRQNYHIFHRKNYKAFDVWFFISRSFIEIWVEQSYYITLFIFIVKNLNTVFFLNQEIIDKKWANFHENWNISFTLESEQKLTLTSLIIAIIDLIICWILMHKIMIISRFFRLFITLMCNIIDILYSIRVHNNKKIRSVMFSKIFNAK